MLAEYLHCWMGDLAHGNRLVQARLPGGGGKPKEKWFSPQATGLYRIRMHASFYRPRNGPINILASIKQKIFRII